MQCTTVFLFTTNIFIQEINECHSVITEFIGALMLENDWIRWNNYWFLLF